MFKKCQVVMLPTNEKANLVMILEGKNRGKLSTYDNLPDGETFKGHNLYFLSDDEIKEGEYGINLSSNSIFKVLKVREDRYDVEFITGGNIGNNIEFHSMAEPKKIIATTNNNLKLIKHIPWSKELESKYDYEKGYPKEINLPQPSQSFIEAYVKAYNEGNAITEVMVEYEEISQIMDYKGTNSLGNYIWVCPKCHDGGSYMGTGSVSCYKSSCITNKLKINPKDNTITIRKIRDSWDREEISQILNDYGEELLGKHIPMTKTRDWVNKNL